MVGARSAATDGAGPCSVGTVISTFATRPIEVNRQPSVSSSGSQSIPSTVTRVEVGSQGRRLGNPAADPDGRVTVGRGQVRLGCDVATLADGRELARAGQR